jgi:hypothetical protein
MNAAMQHHPSRLADWMHRLAALVAERIDQPFKWGPNDCASFTADCVQAQTGFDLLAELRSDRKTQREAEHRKRAIGGVAAAIDRAGLQRVPPALAQRGDVVLVRQGRREVLAVCNGDHAIAPGRLRLGHAPMSQAVQAWRLP